MHVFHKMCVSQGEICRYFIKGVCQTEINMQVFTKKCVGHGAIYRYITKSVSGRVNYAGIAQNVHLSG